VLIHQVGQLLRAAEFLQRPQNFETLFDPYTARLHLLFEIVVGVQLFLHSVVISDGDILRSPPASVGKLTRILLLPLIRRSDTVQHFHNGRPGS
jgi:hypothetical protein